MKRFQDCTYDELNDILLNKVMYIFNYNQFETNIHQLENQEIFELGMNYTAEEFEDLKAHIRINITPENYFRWFTIRVYELGYKVFYKKNPNNIDCLVYVVFNKEEEIFIKIYDYANRMLEQFQRVLLELKGNEKKLNDIKVEHLREFQADLILNLLQAINKHITIQSIDLGFKEFLYPISKNNFYNNLVLINQVFKDNSNSLIEQFR